ncbi:hypothetical protein CPB97_001404, partial [Podila verticillata]
QLLNSRTKSKKHHSMKFSLVFVSTAVLLSNAVLAVTVIVSNNGSPRGTCQGNDVSPSRVFPELGFRCEGSLCTYEGDDYPAACQQLKARVAGCLNVSCASYFYDNQWRHCRD